MKRTGRAWLLIPLIIAAAVVVTVVVSSYQKEVGLIEPNVWGRASVAALAGAYELCDGTTEGDYLAFSRALLVASSAYRNAPSANPADIRLKSLTADILDCLTALREAWQAGMQSRWDTDTHGNARYWNTSHPALPLPAEGALGPDEVRRLCALRAGELLEEAVKLAD